MPSPATTSSTSARAPSRWGTIAITLAFGTVMLACLERLALVIVGSEAPHLSPLAQLAMIGACVLSLLPIASLDLLRDQVMRRLQGARARARETILLAIPLSTVGVIIGHELTAGEWISAQWYAWIIRWGLGVGGFLLATLLPWLFASLGTHLSRPRASVIAALLFGVATLVSVGDRLAKPGLFPKFHVAVFFGVGALLYLGVRLIVTQVAAARLRRPAVSATASALLAVAASIWILMNPGTRSSLLLASPVAANLLREVWPTPSVQLLGGDVLAQDHTSQHHATLRAPEGANVLLITVDAMRADTVPPGRPPKSRYKKKTPFLDRWLERTFRFTYAYAQSTKTLGSLPPMFSSQEAHVDTTRAGIPLAEAAREMGFTPVAVVPTNFLEPRSHGLNRRLVIGYDHLRVYAHEQMNEIDTLVAEVFDSAGPRPVFMWLHLYQLHEPGFDERLLTRKDGSWKARYPRSLAALDREFEEIIGSLDSRGLTENTIIVFASDHGENLGEHGARTHGTDLFDATTRVPLAFHIPGMAGALIDRTVGNIDVLPTIRDLLGLSPDPTHSGRSLVPLMAQPALPWKRAYYLHLRSHKIAGLVYGRQKLLYDWGGGVFHRFDLEQDPGEQRDIYDESGALDGDLRQTLAWHNPSLARDELSAEDNRTELRVSLQEFDTNQPAAAEALRPLLSQVRVINDANLTTAAFDIFERTTDAGLRALIVRQLSGIAAPQVRDAIIGALPTSGGDPTELTLLRQLARYRQPAFDRRLPIQGIRAALESENLEQLKAWLRLVASWKKRATTYGPPLVEALPVVLSQGDDPIIRLLVRNLAGLSQWTRASKIASPLAEQLRPLLGRDDIDIRLSVCTLLGQIGEPERDTELLKAVMENTREDVRVRQAAMHGYAKLAGSDAVTSVVELGDADPLFTVDAVEALRVIGDPQAIPFVARIAREHHHWLTRGRAKKALKQLEADASR